MKGAATRPPGDRLARARHAASRAVRPRLPTSSNVVAVRTRLERATLARRAGTAELRRARVLAYHAVGTWQWGVNDLPPARFRRQMECALGLGFGFAPSASVASAGEDGPAVLAVTFDDGLRSVLDNAAPVLRDLSIPWTVFVVTKWADRRHPNAELFMGWADLEHVVASGGCVGSHSVSHPDFGRISPAEAQDELERSRETINRRLGTAVDEFAIPFGLSRNWRPGAGVAAARAGYHHVYAQSEDRRPPGTIARTFIARHDNDKTFRAALRGAFRAWEERA